MLRPSRWIRGLRFFFPMVTYYYKVLDNIQDEKGFKKIGYILVKPFFKAPYKKAARKYPDIDKIVFDYITEQNAAESNINCELDKVICRVRDANLLGKEPDIYTFDNYNDSKKI